MAPNINVDVIEETITEDKNLNDILTIDLKKITVKDDNDDVIDFEDTINGARKIRVSIVGPEGTVYYDEDESDVDNGVYKYNLTTSGEYTVTFTVRDDAGNSKTLTKTFLVLADESNEIIPGEVWEIILIILALAIIAGITTYFIVTRKSKKNNKPSLPTIRKKVEKEVVEVEAKEVETTTEE